MLFTLPTTAMADITAFIGDVVTDGWEVIAMVIGIPVAFYVVNKVISLATKRAR
jgi:hypothetical protein